MLNNLSITEFKELINCTTFDVVKNPNTQKLFIATDNGLKFKCQQDIDLKKPVEFLMEDSNTETACFINSGTVNVVATF